MFEYLRRMIKQQLFGFKFGYHKALLANLRRPSSVFVVTGSDGQQTISIYLADSFVNLMNFSDTIPGLVVGDKPKRDTVSTTPTSFFCNRAFLLLPDEEKTALYMHEIGHLLCRHLENPENITNGVLNNQQCELEADRFVIDSGYSSGLVAGLKRMRDISAQALTDRNYDVRLYGDAPERMLRDLEERLAVAEGFRAAFDSAK